MDLMSFIKRYDPTHLILLQLSWNIGLWIKGDKVNIPTKFGENLRNVNF